MVQVGTTFRTKMFHLEKSVRLIACVAFICSLSGTEGIQIFLDSLEGKVDENIANVDISIKDRKAVTVNIDAFVDVEHPYIEAQVTIFPPGTDETDGIELFNSSVDYCLVKAYVQMHPILTALFESVKTVTNIPFECPFKKGVYHMTEYVVPQELLPKMDFVCRFEVKILTFINTDKGQKQILSSHVLKGELAAD